MKSNALKKSQNQTLLEDSDFLKKIDLITSSSKFGFFFEDLENNILQATEQLLQISNLPNVSSSEEADRIFSERIDSKYREKVLAQIQLFYNGELEKISEIFEFHRSENEIIWLHLNIIAEKRDLITNKPIKIIGYHQDLTEQKEIELKLIQSAKLESIGLMASSIAHEINTPLTVILGLNQRIKRNLDQLNENEIIRNEISRNVEKIGSTVNRIAKIVKGIKNYSRDNSHENFESINIENFLDDLSHLIEYKIKHDSILFKIEGHIADFQLYCQPVALLQVLVNLINNSVDAIEHLPEKWILLKVEKSESVITLKVIDSGNGIDLKIQDKIMNPFFTTKNSEKGTGIGLGISLAIVNNHSGKFYLDNQSPNTTFVVELPLLKSA